MSTCFISDNNVCITICQYQRNNILSVIGSGYNCLNNVRKFGPPATVKSVVVVTVCGGALGVIYRPSPAVMLSARNSEFPLAIIHGYISSATPIHVSCINKLHWGPIFLVQCLQQDCFAFKIDSLADTLL